MAHMEVSSLISLLGFSRRKAVVKFFPKMTGPSVGPRVL